MLAQVFAAVFLLGICIFFHELGHFLIGKWVGVQPKIFSIGYGRALWFKKVGRTIYQITAIPLGGYVQFYNDDITRKKSKIKKGDFFSVGPWKRIALAMGGPLFSILLGLIVIMWLVASGWQPVDNTIVVKGKDSMAYKAGLRTGDRIVEVDKQEIDSFEKLLYTVGFSDTQKLPLKVLRDNKELTVMISPRPREAGNIRMIEGISPMGQEFLAANNDVRFPGGEILEGDKLLKANGKPLKNVNDLVDIINTGKKESVLLEISRRSGSFFAPEAEETVSVKAPLHKNKVLVLDNVFDAQTQAPLPTTTIFAKNKNMFNRLGYKNEYFSDWKNLENVVNKQIKNKNNQIRFNVGAIEINTTAKLEERKLIGVQLLKGIKPKRAALPRDFASIVTRGIDQTLFVTKGTLMGLYRLFEGKLSFEKSVSGPVKIVAIAAKSVTTGWDTWWFLLAQITIVLGIMNLLPFPVLDGGHIIFYLIEAIYKPLPPRIIAASVRLGFVFLLTLGIYVIGLDIWDVFVRGFI